MDRSAVGWQQAGDKVNLRFKEAVPVNTNALMVTKTYPKKTEPTNGSEM